MVKKALGRRKASEMAHKSMRNQLIGDGLTTNGQTFGARNKSVLETPSNEKAVIPAKSA